MSFLSRLRTTATRTGGVLSVITSARELSAKLSALSFDPVYLTGFVSPHVDFDQVARSVAARFPNAKISLCTTSGELCSSNDSLYCAADNQWDRIVLALFDASVIKSAEVVHIPLHSEDIRGAGKRLSMRERIARLTDSIKRTQVSTPIDHRETLAYVTFDGLSASESFFMEALYESGRFPCLFVGGSAGGKGDFQKTLIHDGKRSYENHAQVVFLKSAKNVRFGVFNSPNACQETGLGLAIKCLQMIPGHFLFIFYLALRNNVLQKICTSQKVTSFAVLTLSICRPRLARWRGRPADCKQAVDQRV